MNDTDLSHVSDLVTTLIIGMCLGTLIGVLIGTGVKISKVAQALGRGITWPVRRITRRAAGSRVWSHRDWEASPGRSAVEYDREGRL